MKKEQGISRLPEGRKKESVAEKDQAEILFDKIMADVRASKKTDEPITFKTHEDYDKWKTLRDANFEQGTLDIASEKAAILKAKEAEAKRVADLEELSIDRFYKPGKKAGDSDDKKQVGALLRGKDSRPLQLTGKLTEGGFSGEQAEKQIAGILKEMEQLKNIFSIQIKALGEMGVWATISGRKAALKQEMDKVKDQICLESETLLKEFQVSGKILENQHVIMDNLHDLSKKLEGEVSLGEATVALAVLATVLASCAGQVVSKVSAADSFRSSSGASFDAGHGANDSDANGVIEDSQNFPSSVSGYRVSVEPVYLPGASTEVIGSREVFSLTTAESDSVKNFTDWRHQILNHIYIEMKANGSIPTTEKGLNVPVGTKLFITVNGDEELEMTVKKGGNIWHELGEKRQKINQINKKNGGFGQLDLVVVTPVVAKDSTSGQSYKIKKMGRTGDAIPKIKDGNVDNGNSLEVAQKKVQAEANKFLGTKGIDHVFGQLYNSVGEADIAYEKLKKVYDEIEVRPAVDGEFSSAEDELLFNVKHTIWKEMQHLKSADSLLSEPFSNDGLEHEDAKTEPIHFSHVPQVDDLVSEHDLAIRAGGKYSSQMIDAWYLVSKVDGSLKSSLGVDLKEEDAEKFSNQAKEAETIYQKVLVSIALQTDGPLKVFVTKQANIGLEIAKAQVADLGKFLPEKKVTEVIDNVQIKFSALYNNVKDNKGNSALYGKNQALETVQLIIENTKSNGKISNADKTKLRKLNKDLHIILHSDRSSEPDKETAKRILDIVNDLNHAVSFKDQNIVDIADSAGMRYKLPNLPN